MRLASALLLALTLLLPAVLPASADDATAQAFRRYVECLERHGEADARTTAALEALRALQAAAPAATAGSTVAALPAGTVDVPNATPPFHRGTPRPAAADSGDNYCGQYAMSTIFSALGIDPGFDRVYKDMNPYGIFTAPIHFVEYAKRRGAPARSVTGATRDQLKAELDAGRPVALLLSCDGGVKSVHWVAITGYKVENGKTLWKTCDSYWGVGSKEGHVWMTDDELAQRWDVFLSHPTLGAGVSYKNQAVFFDGRSGLAAEHRTAVEDGVLGGVNDVVAGWGNRRPGQVVAGVVEAGFGVLGLPGAAVGRTLKWGGNWLEGKGRSVAAGGSAFARIAGGAVEWAGKGVGLLGTVADFAGRTVSWVGNKIGSLFH